MDWVQVLVTWGRMGSVLFRSPTGAVVDLLSWLGTLYRWNPMHALESGFFIYWLWAAIVCSFSLSHNVLLHEYAIHSF